jgi:hypothetical protein
VSDKIPIFMDAIVPAWMEILNQKDKFMVDSRRVVV